jgi:anti-anti-sigma factor
VNELAEIVVTHRDNTVVVTITGEVDHSNAGDIGAALMGHAETDGTGLVVDLSSLEFLASAGIRMLLRLRATQSGKAGLLRVVVPPHAPIKRVLDVVDIPNLMRLDASVDEALASLDGGAPS